MSTPALARTLPTPAEIALAVEDSDYYADTLTRLGKDSPEGTWFAAEVERAYNAAHPRRPLTGREIRILDIAGRTFPNAGRREEFIRRHLAISATRFYQLLGALLDRPEAAAYAPVTVNRLRAVRAARQAARQNHTTEGSAA